MNHVVAIALGAYLYVKLRHNEYLLILCCKNMGSKTSTHEHVAIPVSYQTFMLKNVLKMTEITPNSH